MISLFRNNHFDDGMSAIGNEHIAIAFGMSPVSNLFRISSRTDLILADTYFTSEGFSLADLGKSR